MDVQYADEEMREALPQRNNARKTKGRGFQDRDADVEDDRGGRYDTHGMDSRGPVKCEACFAASYKLLLNSLCKVDQAAYCCCSCGELGGVCIWSARGSTGRGHSRHIC